MRFHYVASDINGRASEGYLNAQDPSAVLGWMAQRGLKPISVKPAEESGTSRFFKKSFKKKIKIEDRVFLVKYLSLMLSVGTDLFRAVDILIGDFKNPSMKNLLTEMKDSLSKGQQFYTTFEKYPNVFSNVFVKLIKAGETSGHLGDVLGKLSTDMTKQYELRNRIRSSLIYPIILVILALVILFFMVSIALPRIADSFASGLADPPTFSKIVFAIGAFANQFMIPILIISISSSVGIWVYAKKSVRARETLLRFVHRIPVVGDVLRKISLQRFASTLSSLLRSGTPILESIEVTSEAVGHGELQDALIRISREGISKGLTIGEAFRREEYFPHVVTNLMAISEQSGHIEEVLETLSNFYETEIDSSVKSLVSFIEPALLVFIGIIVGTIALAIIVPIYQLVGSI